MQCSRLPMAFTQESTFLIWMAKSSGLLLRVTSRLPSDKWQIFFPYFLTMHRGGLSAMMRSSVLICQSLWVLYNSLNTAVIESTIIMKYGQSASDITIFIEFGMQKSVNDSSICYCIQLGHLFIFEGNRFMKIYLYLTS